MSAPGRTAFAYALNSSKVSSYRSLFSARTPRSAKSMTTSNMHGLWTLKGLCALSTLRSLNCSM